MKKRKERDYSIEIDEALKQYEEYKPYITKDIDWICGRIDWCWKFRKITREQMEEFAERAIQILNNSL